MTGNDRITDLGNVLLELYTGIPGIKSACFVTVDGFVLASVNDKATDLYETGLLVSALAKKSKAFMEGKPGHEVRRISIRCENGESHYFPVNPMTGLFVISESGSRSGILLLRAGKFIDMLRTVLGPGSKGQSDQ